MPYNGLPPKDENSRVNRVKSKYDKTVLPVADGVLRGPDLPEFRRPWCTRTLEWWDMWRKSPQALLMTETDWETMLEAAIIHNEIWRNRMPNDRLSPNALVQLMSELRQRVASFGATWEDRQKLRLTIDAPMSKEEEDAKIAADAQQAVNYVERLTQHAAKEKGKK